MKTYKNLLVQYKGGGYDGCHWEWNYFIFDSEGGFHSLRATGFKGIKNEQEALKLLNEGSKLVWGGSEYYTYDLLNKDSRDEFSSECVVTEVEKIGTIINNIYKKPLFSFQCDECEDTIDLNHDGNDYPRMFHDPNNYAGDGGVGIIQYGKLCEDCYFNHSCGYCGSFNEIDENNIDEAGHCTYCKPEVKGGEK